MKYLSDKRKSKKHTKHIAYLFTVIVISFFWIQIKTSAFPVLEPLVTTYSETKQVLIKVPIFFSTYVSSRESLVKENKSLEKVIENLENELAEKNAKIKELSLIKDDAVDPLSDAVIVMYPLARDITRIYSTILLSKGYRDGVEKEGYVYVRGLQPVCIIREVYTSSSLCELLSSSSVTTEAVIEGVNASTSVMISLVGRGGGAFLGNVPRDTQVSNGDKVFLRSDRSMMIGQVVEVLHNNQDTSWRVFVRGAYNPVTSSVFYSKKTKL